MRIVKSKRELAKFLKNEVLPYYKNYYENGDFSYSNMSEKGVLFGICHCSFKVFKVDIYKIMPDVIYDKDGCAIRSGYSYKVEVSRSSILKRIEWMEDYIEKHEPSSWNKIKDFFSTIYQLFTKGIEFEKEPKWPDYE